MKFDKNNCCLITKNHEGKLVVFTKRQFDLKANQRPELREKGILKRIEETINNPTFIYEDYEHRKQRVAYYCFEYKINGRSRYMKVMLSVHSDYLFVVTAYRPDYIKERGKTNLLYGKDND